MNILPMVIDTVEGVGNAFKIMGSLSNNNVSGALDIISNNLSEAYERGIQNVHVNYTHDNDLSKRESQSRKRMLELENRRDIINQGNSNLSYQNFNQRSMLNQQNTLGTIAKIEARHNARMDEIQANRKAQLDIINAKVKNNNMMASASDAMFEAIDTMKSTSEWLGQATSDLSNTPQFSNSPFDF